MQTLSSLIVTKIIAVLCWTTFKDLSPLFCIINFAASTKSESFMLCYFYCHCSFSIAYIRFLKYKVIMFFLFLCFSWSPVFSIMAELKSFFHRFSTLKSPWNTVALFTDNPFGSASVKRAFFLPSTHLILLKCLAGKTSVASSRVSNPKGCVNFAPWPCYQS